MKKKQDPIKKPAFDESVHSYRTEYESWKRTKIVPGLLGIFEIPADVLRLASVPEIVSRSGLEGYSVVSYTDEADYAPRSIVPMGITVSVRKPYGKVQPVIFLKQDMLPDEKDAPEELKWALRLLMLMHELGHAEDVSLGINLKPDKKRGDLVAAEAYAHAFVCKHARRKGYWRALRSYVIELENGVKSADEVWRLGTQRAVAELDIKGLRAECAVHVE